MQVVKTLDTFNKSTTMNQNFLYAVSLQHFIECLYMHQDIIQHAFYFKCVCNDIAFKVFLLRIVFKYMEIYQIIQRLE